MTKEMKLLTAIGWVKDEYIQEMMEPGRARVPRKKIWLVAALVAVTLLLTGCAAVIFMSLESQTVHQEIRKDDAMEPTRMENLISLQGMAGSPQFQAAQEWADFIRAYDPDSKIIQSTPSEEMDQGEEYYSYNCYTPEMARKIDEICGKYGLEKQGKPQIEQSWENLCRVLQLEGTFNENSDILFSWDSGYLYRSGSFMVEGDVEFTPEESVGFQFKCVSKKDFDEVCLNIGDPEKYREWTATAADGGEVLLAVSPDKALILADREDKFVSLNFMVYERKITAEELGQIAALLDFSFRLHPISDENWAYLEKNPQRPTATEVEKAYAERVQIILDAFPQAKTWEYTIMDTDNDGAQDLVIGKDGMVRNIFSVYSNGKVYSGSYTLSVHDNMKATVFGDPAGTPVAPSYGYLCEGYKLLNVYEKNDDTVIYEISGILDETQHWGMIHLIEDRTQNAYFRHAAGEIGYQDYLITKEEFDEILNTCVPVQLDMKPLTEFPLA